MNDHIDLHIALRRSNARYRKLKAAMEMIVFILLSAGCYGMVSHLLQL